MESRARAELLASGARPRRTALTGTGSLTPSEERIATLLANGLPTRAVADDLHLSISTIDWHRRNIYRKLDIRSRTELREALSID
ncbi:helix-turn-helix domain-containing protein [Paenarthrobacter nitroguajacolicus]|uniref:helix-turn-helix domain-containing protein n=1 Tax=Paenarthrobacter nitroguajacolicus TaxID=211146 RepID=UPI003D2287AE